MDRRSFLRGVAVSPAAVALASGAASAPKPFTKDQWRGVISQLTGENTGGIRVSCEEDDPGYRDYCLARGDGKTIKVYLDGVEQKKCIIADESTGMVKRVVMTPEGNIAHDGTNIFHEEVFGLVQVVIS